MTRDVLLQDAPPFMADDKEAGEDAEGGRGHREEVHGRDVPNQSRKKRTVGNSDSRGRAEESVQLLIFISG
jgi:hypothetical protein